MKRQAGDLTGAAQTVLECHTMLAELDDDAVSELGPELVPLRAEWALTSTLLGDEELALRGWERTWDQAQRFDLPAEAHKAAAAVAVVHALNGDRRYATMWLERVDPSPDDPAAPLASVARASLALDELDYAQAEHELALAEPLSTSERWATLAFVDARLAAMQGKDTSGMTRLRATCLAHYPKQWSGGANWQLIDSATLILDRVESRSTRKDSRGSAVTEYADLLIGLRAVEKDSPSTARTIAEDNLGRSPVSLRTTAGMQLLLAMTTPDEDEAAALIDAALETIRTERLFYLLSKFTDDRIQSRATDHEELIPYLADDYDPRTRQAALTKREREILWYIAQGYRFEQIAAAEYISVNTVKSHAKKLYRRIDVNSRSSAARYAAANPGDPLPPADAATGSATGTSTGTN
ncbi:LuxR C-terminal-related transcriptional regulator [Herbiconiux sp. P15]|uniref:helix-turn-helix transcriptional regulator n=1 Tax=Herbiconiux liukaitaii TaxID=3342799 RepID=UPI0035B7F916